MTKKRFNDTDKSEVKKEKQIIWTPEQWINDDCKVRECINGLIHYENYEYATVARCPKCDRAKSQDGYLMDGIPRYQGNVTLRTESDMIDRKEERVTLITDHNYRRNRSREFFNDIQKTITAIAAADCVMEATG